MLRDKDGQSCSCRIIVGHTFLEEKVKGLIVGPELVCYMPGQAIKRLSICSSKGYHILNYSDSAAAKQLYTQMLPPFLSGFITSMPADGTSAFEQLLHDFVYVRVEQAMLGQSVWPCELCTPESPVRLTVTGPQ